VTSDTPDDRSPEARVLSDLMWIRERVVNVVGHELRTPASTIRGLAEALAHADDPARAGELVAALQRQAVRLERLVDDLLAAAHVTSSLPLGTPTRVDVAPILDAAWADAGGSPERLVLDLGEPSVTARARSVRRIFDHVLANAVTVGAGTARVASRRADRRVLLVVDSPGPELPPEDIRFATEMFWRGERAVTSAPGLGLGLAVAGALAEHEAGSLAVEALAGGGVRTTITLPAA
jgi:signal transduction histidine kinase